MIDLNFVVTKNLKLTDNIFELTLQTEKLPEIKAGQFVEVAIPAHGEMLLRRPFCVYSVDGKKNTLKIGVALRGNGSNELSKQNVGDVVQILLPLGNGFPKISMDKKILFVGGGVGVLPLLSVAESVKNEMSCCLGFKDKSSVIKAHEFEKLMTKECVFATDDGSFGEGGYVADVLKKHIEQMNPDVIFACGPEVMLRGLKAFDNVEMYVSLEQRMGCGIGACLVCSCKTKKNGVEHFERVCADGPVFKFGEVFYD